MIPSDLQQLHQRKMQTAAMIQSHVGVPMQKQDPGPPTLQETAPRQMMGFSLVTWGPLGCGCILFFSQWAQIISKLQIK